MFCSLTSAVNPESRLRGDRVNELLDIHFLKHFRSEPEEGNQPNKHHDNTKELGRAAKDVPRQVFISNSEQKHDKPDDVSAETSGGDAAQNS